MEAGLILSVTEKNYKLSEQKELLERYFLEKVSLCGHFFGT